MKINDFARNLAVIFAISIGLYPLLYLGTGVREHGLLQTKPQEILHSLLWNIAFFIHISAGGFALLTGWLQFNPQRRNRHLKFHRVLGRFYAGAVALSGIAGLYVAFFATGGLISATGFGTLASCWLFTDFMAFKTAVHRQIDEHRRWMIVNYSLTFAAVTLRLWLPLFLAVFHFEFIPAYRIIAWLCWVPNLLLALWIIRGQQERQLAQQ